MKTQSISGDLNVSRRATVGGHLTARGNATIDHDLVVNGWLEAKNIKGVIKGVFKNLFALAKAYPKPDDGWAALVVSEQKLVVYTAQNNMWTATDITYEFKVEIDNVENHIEEVSGDLEDFKDAMETETVSIRSRIKELNNEMNDTFDEYSKDTKSKIESAKTELSEAHNADVTRIDTELQKLSLSTLVNVSTEGTQFDNISMAAIAVEQSRRVPGAMVTFIDDDGRWQMWQWKGTAKSRVNWLDPVWWVQMDAEKLQLSIQQKVEAAKTLLRGEMANTSAAVRKDLSEAQEQIESEIESKEAYTIPEPLLREEFTGSPFVGIEFKTNAEVFLYNVKRKLFLTENNTDPSYWTSKARLETRGRLLRLEATSYGTTIDPKMGHSHSFNKQMWMDTNESVLKWHFFKQSEGSNYYTLYTGNSEALTENMEVQLLGSDLTPALWQFVTPQERIAYCKALATPTSPMDMSWMIRGGTFPVDDDDMYYWKGERGQNSVGGDAKYQCNRVWELWDISERDVFQTVNGIPNGRYEVRARALYSPSEAAGVSLAHYNAYHNGAEPTKGVIYANDKSTPMRNMYEMAGGYIADRRTRQLSDNLYAYNGVNEVSAAIFEGNCITDWIEVRVTNGELRVGARVSGADGAAWITVDRFEMRYLGE